MLFLLFVLFIIALRIGELILSKRNEQWLLQNGAVEYGRAHYPYIVALHTAFIVALLVEYYFRPATGSLLLFIVYCLLLVFKAWVLLTLGKFWNTRIYRIPNVALVKAGPYKYIKHPNYIIVISEILLIPLIFQLYYTAIIFSILNGIMLYVRIREENKALGIG